MRPNVKVAQASALDAPTLMRCASLTLEARSRDVLGRRAPLASQCPQAYADPLSIRRSHDTKTRIQPHFSANLHLQLMPTVSQPLQIIGADDFTRRFSLRAGN